MPFPIDYRGEVRWRSKVSLRGEHLQHAVLHELVRALAGAKGTPIVHGNRISFTGGMFRFVPNWNILVPITHGSLEVTLVDDTVVVSYYLNFKQQLVLASMIALISLSFLAASTEPLAVRIGFPAFIWVWTCGLSYVITIPRFSRFIKRAIQRASL